MKKILRDAEFRERFSKHERELSRLFNSLYSDQGACAAFETMLERAFNQRREALKELDRARLKEQTWYLSPTRNGVLDETEPAADYLTALPRRAARYREEEISFLLLPPLVNGAEDTRTGEYVVSDHCHLRPEIGSLQEFSDVCDACRKEGVDLWLDDPLHRISPDHAWVKQAQAGDAAAKLRFLNCTQKKTAATGTKKLPSSFSMKSEQQARRELLQEEKPKSAPWTLNYANPSVLTDMTAALFALCNCGVGGLCLRGLPQVCGEEAEADASFAHKIMRMLRLSVEIVCPSVLLIAGDSLPLHEAAAWLGTEEKGECHLLLDTTAAPAVWHTVGTKDGRLLRHGLNELFSKGLASRCVRSLRPRGALCWNLDYAFLNCLGQQEEPHRAYLNAYLTGSWPGSPARGRLCTPKGAPDNQAIQGTTAELCGEGAAGLPLSLHALLYLIGGQPMLCSKDELLWPKALRSLRAAHRAFDAKADMWTLNSWDNCFLGIGRYYDGEKIIGLFNFDSQSKRTTLWHEEGEFYDLLSGVRINKRDIEIKAEGFRYLACDFHHKDLGRRPKLIFVDVDGTLTLPGGIDPPRSAREAVRQAKEQGNVLILCSGRSRAMLKPFLALGFDGMIADAGAYVELAGEVLFDYPMKDSQRDTALRLFAQNGVSVLLHTLEGSYCDEGFSRFLKGFSSVDGNVSEWSKNDEIFQIYPIDAYDGQPVYKIDFLCPDRLCLDEAIQTLGQDYDFLLIDTLYENSVYGELTSRKYDKGSGVRRVAEALGVDLKDTYGFGDSMNDAEMIQTVGTGVCVSDGSRALQDMSDLVCPPLEEDGLAWAFHKLGLTGV